MNVEALLASPRWRWMPGMLDINHDRVVEVVDIEDMHDGCERTLATVVRGRPLGRIHIVCQVYIEQLEAPDLTDPGTLGCLLALVREALACPGATTYLRDDGWRVSLGGNRYQADAHASEAEALVAALPTGGR